jgi:hypothetical protein
MVKAWQHQQQQPLLSSQLKHQPVQQPGWPHQQQQQQQSQAVPRLMVIYRVGSVVFAGTEQGEEARLLAAMVPPGVCYSAGHSPWTAAAGGWVGGVRVRGACGLHACLPRLLTHLPACCLSALPRCRRQQPQGAGCRGAHGGGGPQSVRGGEERHGPGVCGLV